MVKLNIPSTYRIDLSGKVRIGGIPEMLLYDRLRDGRIMGLLIEDILAGHFAGLTRSAHAGAAHDLFLTTHTRPQRLQCKTFKGSQVSLAPSVMKGAGRKFDAQACDAYMMEIDAWLLTDISAFPKLTVHAVSTSRLIDIRRVGKSDAVARIADITA